MSASFSKPVPRPAPCSVASMASLASRVSGMGWGVVPALWRFAPVRNQIRQMPQPLCKTRQLGFPRVARRKCARFGCAGCSMRAVGGSGSGHHYRNRTKKHRDARSILRGCAAATSFVLENAGLLEQFSKPGNRLCRLIEGGVERDHLILGQYKASLLG